MIRYHDWHQRKVPDFWSNYYKHGELLKYFANVNNVLASKSGSYSLLNFYDIMKLDSHEPGITDAWVPLETLGYLYKPGDTHPYHYLISDDILKVETIYDRHIDPDIELHPNVQFRLEPHAIGYVDRDYLLKFSVLQGNYNGAAVIELQSKVVELDFIGTDPEDSKYRYLYSMPDKWKDLTILKHLYNHKVYIKGEDYIIVDGVVKSTHELPRYPSRICFNRPLPVNTLTVDAAHKGATYVDRSSEIRFTPYNGVLVAGDYPYQYDISEHFSNIYELSDPLKECVYTSGTDFVYDPINSKISFKEELQIGLLYMSKVYRADTRINDEYGQFVGFSRYDSRDYRDSMEILMRLFFKGPTKNNLVSAFNVMLNQPVAKYGNEKILSMASGEIITDKYDYKFGNTASDYVIGSKIKQYQPFGKAITIDLWDPKNPLDTKWWEQRPVELFQRYSSTPLTDPNKNTLMDTFLKSFVGHVRVNLDEMDSDTLVFNKDLWSTILDGIPARSDFILSSFKGISTIGQLSVPTKAETPGWGIYLHSVWSKYHVCESPEWLYPPEVLDFKIETEGLHYYPWYIGSRKYHILNEGCQFDEFWRDGDKLSYVEPNYDSWWYNLTTTPPPASAVVSEVRFVYDWTTPIPDKSRYYPRRSDGYSTGNSATTKFDAIPSYDMIAEVGYASIPPEIICGKSNMHNWMFFDTRMTTNGVEANVHASGQKYILTAPLNIGLAPKNIQFDFFINLIDTKNRTWIDIEYGQEGADRWTIMPADNTVRGVTGKLYLKIIFHTYASVSPVFSGYKAIVTLQE